MSLLGYSFCGFAVLTSAHSDLLAQPGPVQQGEERFEATYSEDEYLDDLDQLAQLLVETHPQPFEFMTEEAFWRRVQEAAEQIGPSTTLPQFLWHCSEIIAALGCVHTTMDHFNQEDRVLPDSLRFPLDAMYLGERLFVVDPLVNTDVPVGSELLSVNGTAVADIRAGAFRHISSDGYSTGIPQQNLNAYLSAYIPYQLAFPSSYQVEIQGVAGTVELKQLENHRYRSTISPHNECQQDLCLLMVEDEGYARLVVRSFAFYGESFDEFESFIDESFAAILKSGRIESLIVDVRGNGGGTSYAGSYLLSHIADGPFTYFAKGSAGDDVQKAETLPAENRFRGQVYVLMDGAGGSTTGHFLSLVKANGFGILVGQEAGSTYTCNDNGIRHSLANTGAYFYVARDTFYTTATGLPKDRGVMPDHAVPLAVDDLLGQADTTLEYTVDQIAANAR